MKSLEEKFKIKERKSTIKTEVIAGITTFMTMAYVLAVVPKTLSMAGVPYSGAFAATAITACIATFLVGMANFPFGLAPSLGMNAFFVFSIVLGSGKSWQFALTGVAISGMILLILTLTKIREKLFNIIPFNLKMAMIAGIGLFVALIGLSNAGLIVAGKGTIVQLGNLKDPKTFLVLVGLLVTATLMHKKIKGALFFGIVSITIIGIFFGVTEIPKNWEIMPSLNESAFKFVGLKEIFSLDMAVAIFTFLFVAIFDTVGTLIGLAGKAKLLDENNELPGINKICMCDSIGTIIAGCLGTSLIGTFVESASGISEGGKTGLAALTTSLLFLIALFLSPLFIMIPAAATSPALIIVGLLMLSTIKSIEFDDITEGLPAFLTIILMPLTYSIAEGIMFGIIFYVVMKILTGKIKILSPVIIALAICFILKIIFI